jgi:hypothetical protein
LLRQESIAQVRRPLNLIGQPFSHIGQRSKCLDARVPVLFFRRIHQRLAFEVFVLSQPLLKLDDFEWIRGGSQDLS